MVRLNIQAFAVWSTACTVLSVSNRLQDLSLPDVTRIDSDLNARKVEVPCEERFSYRCMNVPSAKQKFWKNLAKCQNESLFNVRLSRSD